MKNILRILNYLNTGKSFHHRQLFESFYARHTATAFRSNKKEFPKIKKQNVVETSTFIKSEIIGLIQDTGVGIISAMSGFTISKQNT